MRSADPYLAEREMNMRVESELRQAQVRGLAGTSASRQPGRLARYGQEFLCELGYQLVALGARLESYAAVPEG